MVTIRFTTDPDGNEIGLHYHEGHVGRIVDDGTLHGKDVTEPFLGHSPSTTTDIYTQATLAKVATVVASLTSELHSLADQHRRPGHAA